MTLAIDCKMYVSRVASCSGNSPRRACRYNRAISNWTSSKFVRCGFRNGGPVRFCFRAGIRVCSDIIFRISTPIARPKIHIHRSPFPRVVHPGTGSARSDRVHRSDREGVVAQSPKPIEALHLFLSPLKYPSFLFSRKGNRKGSNGLRVPGVHRGPSFAAPSAAAISSINVRSRL